MIDKTHVSTIRTWQLLTLNSNYLQSPHLFVCVDLFAANESTSVQANVNNALAGTSVSSLYRLKDIDNSGIYLKRLLPTKFRWRLFCLRGSFCADWGTISIKILFVWSSEVYRRVAPLTCRADVCFLQSITSDVFQVYSAKQFPGMLDSTFLSRSFSERSTESRCLSYSGSSDR